MRTVSPEIQTLLDIQPNSMFHLFLFEGQNISYQFTTHSTDLAVPSLHADPFLANNSISEFTPPIIERASNREQYTISFVDADFELRAEASSSIVGARVTVYFGLINKSNGILGGANPGEPLLLPEHLTLGFDGLIDSKEYVIDPDEATAIFKIECATPMASLNDVRPYITSKTAVKVLDPADTCYDQIYEGTSGTDLLWGKIP